MKRSLPYIPVLAILLLGAVAAEARWSFNPFRLMRIGRDEVRTEKFERELDQALPGAMVRMAQRLIIENKSVQVVVGVLVLLTGGKGYSLGSKGWKAAMCKMAATRKGGQGNG